MKKDSVSKESKNPKRGNRLKRTMTTTWKRTKHPKGKRAKRTLEEKLVKYEHNAAGYEFIPVLMHSLRRYLNAGKSKNYFQSRLEFALKDIPDAKAHLKKALEMHDAIPQKTKERLFDKTYLNYDKGKDIPMKDIPGVLNRGKGLLGKNVATAGIYVNDKKEKHCCCDDDEQTPPPPKKNRYLIKFDHLVCVDESDPEWLGSDEPYIVFATITEEMVLNGTAAHAVSTPVYADVDDGNRRPGSGSEDLRLYGFTGAAEIASSLLITGNCFEHDLGDVSDTTDKIRSALTAAASAGASAGGYGWLVTAAAVIGIGVTYLVDLIGADDAIGSTETRSLLDTDADNMTGSVTTATFSPMHFNGGDSDGIYDATITITRS